MKNRRNDKKANPNYPHPENWICPIDSLDPDIRELVEYAYYNGLYPYMSCSGSYEDHKDESVFPTCGSIEFLDSEEIREIMAKLLKDKRFACTIIKAPATTCYDNELPEGLRFRIEFENIDGNIQEELLPIFQNTISRLRNNPSYGQKKSYNRKRVDSICNRLDEFNVNDGHSQLSFSFNPSKCASEYQDAENYAVEINGRRKTEALLDNISSSLAKNNIDIDVDQKDNTSTIYGRDFNAMVAILKHVSQTYTKLPYLGRGDYNPSKSLPDNYIDRFNDISKIEKHKIAEQGNSEFSDSSTTYSLDSLNAFMNLSENGPER